MLTALAPSPVALPVHNSPPSTTDSTQPAGRESFPAGHESFKNVYGNVSGEDSSKGDSGAKQKSTDTSGAKPKKGTEEDNNKTRLTVVSQQPSVVVQKAPLAFEFPSLSQDVPSEPESSNAPQDQAQPTAQSTGDNAIQTPLPNFSATPSKPDPVAATASIPANEKLAFSARLTPPEVPAMHPMPAPRISTPQPSRPQSTNDSRTLTAPSVAKDAYQTASTKTANPEAVLSVREAAPASAIDFRQASPPLQPAEPLKGTPAHSLAIQDIQPTEIPKPPTSTEILLHLAGQDHSTASVRVVDRSGMVNVTVHAADPDLRSSLRSNLTDLASQLTGQGFKTEVVKPTVIAANADNQNDSRHNGQNSPSQQQHQSSQDGRQPQRDRRANSERWLDEFEKEAPGTPGAPGGKD